MTNFTIQMSHRSAKLYLVKEFGIQRGLEILRNGTIAVSPGFVRIPLCERTFLDTMRNQNGRLTGRVSRPKWRAEMFAERVRSAVAYQCGRLGAPWSGGDVYVVETN